MTPFKSYRFGSVEVYQAGAWGTATGWRINRGNGPAMCSVDNEVDAVMLGIALSKITIAQLSEARDEALRTVYAKEAAE